MAVGDKMMFTAQPYREKHLREASPIPVTVVMEENWQKKVQLPDGTTLYAANGELVMQS